MSECKSGKIDILDLILLLFLVSLFIQPIYAHAVSSSEGTASRFDNIEMPPVPGQVYGRPADKTREKEESLPPAVKEMDKQIRQETQVLRRGFHTPESKPEGQAGPESGPGYKAKPEYSPSLPKTPTNKLVRPKIEVPGSMMEGAQSGSYAPTESKAAGAKASAEKTITLKKAGGSTEKTPAAKKSGKKASGATSCAIGITTAGKVSTVGSFLKGLIIFAVVGMVGFGLLRRYVLKNRVL